MALLPPYVPLPRPNWTKSRQKSKSYEFSSLLFTVTSTALPWDFYFCKLTQPLTVSSGQLLSTEKVKEGKTERKPYPLPYAFRNAYRTSSLRTLKIMPRNLNEIVRSWIRLLSLYSLCSRVSGPSPLPTRFYDTASMCFKSQPKPAENVYATGYND